MRVLFLLLPLLLGADVVEARFLLNASQTLATSTCSGAFNAPCSVGIMNGLVTSLSEALASATTSPAVIAILDEVNVLNGRYTAETNFWCSVVNATGGYLASGRPPLDGNPASCAAASCMVGKTVEEVALTETGLLQPGLWDHIVTAAESGDGYFTFSGFDNHNEQPGTPLDAVTRIGFVKKVTVPSMGVMYVTSAFSDVALTSSWSKRACSPAYDTLCSIAYVRKTLGTVTTKLLRAETPSMVQEVLSDVVWRKFNEQRGEDKSAIGFYPFVFTFEPSTIQSDAAGGGTCVAHGSNPTFVGKTLAQMLNNSAMGRSLGISFAEAAVDGGGYVAYWWPPGADRKMKISFVVGVERFGVNYYLGVGFNHKEKTRTQGPGCAACVQSYNYPCAWENVLALVGHVQSLMFMAKGTEAVSLETAFQNITYDAAYGADQSIVASGGSTGGMLYAFVFNYRTGLCVAHGAKASFKDTLTTSRHQIYMSKADAGGGWVFYEWRNNPNEAWYTKAAYVTKVVRDGEEYYVGVGLSQLPYDVGTDAHCSMNWQAPCAEAWAHRIAGERITQMFNATDHDDLKLALSSGRDLASPESPIGFASHVHTSVFVHGGDSEVYADGHIGSDAYLMKTSDWFGSVGISSSDLEPARHSEVGFMWLGPFPQFHATSSSPPAPHYLLYVPVPMEDRLTPNAGDGIGDEYAVIVAVSAGAPLPNACGASDVTCFDYATHMDICPAKVHSVCTGTTSGGSTLFEFPAVGGGGYDCGAKSDFPFYDTAPFDQGNSEQSIQAWSDTSSSVELCGCPAGSELIYLKPTTLLNATCVGTAGSVANIHAMHQPYEVACAESTEIQPVGAIVGGSIGGALAFACLFLLCYRRNAQKKLEALKRELEDFRDSVVGMRAVSRDYDPRVGMGVADAIERQISNGSGKIDASEVHLDAIKKELGLSWLSEPVEVAKQAALMLGLEYSSESMNEAMAKVVLKTSFEKMFGTEISGLDGAESLPSGVGEPEPDLAPEAVVPTIALARWYWQEDGGVISKHNPADVLQPGNWVSYSLSVCNELDRAWAKQKGKGTTTIDLADRIGSTGTEQKAQKAETGVVFHVTFDTMEQKNARSGFVRKMKRVETSPAGAPSTAAAAAAAATKANGKGGNRRSSKDLASNKKTKDVAVTAARPMETRKEDGLLMREGQIIQVSKNRPDGWAFGNVVWDPMPDRPLLGVDGVSTVAGWFPLDATDVPTADQLKSLQESMSKAGDDALKPPLTWSKGGADPMKVNQVPVTGAERDEVVKAFMSTVRSNFKVLEVLRVENLAMWQSYAVKRTSIISREIDDSSTKISSMDNAAAVSKYVRKWLWHGTAEDVVAKIVEQGFNRSFSGLHAVRYGKGVYFARDSWYSAQPLYSKPNSKGVKFMFACRVVVGEYCLGTDGALTPDVRKGHLLYDSTVNDMRDPQGPLIYVTYHDAQAYPEYLIKYKD